MRGIGTVRIALSGLAAVIGVAAGAQVVTALGSVAPGLWELHEIGSSSPARPICVKDPRMLFQIEHGAAACTRTMISDGPRAATVRYVCPGAGNGLTEIRVESASILRVHTQGVSRGAPFDIDYEARLRGACPARVASR